MELCQNLGNLQVGSRSDQLFNKRKAIQKQELVRRQATLSVRKRVLIVCEGEKTEPHYFNTLVDSLNLTTAEVEVCGNCGSAPLSVVNFGKQILDEDSDFDQIFFVFDRDAHTDYDSALNSIEGLQQNRKNKRNEYLAITSYPCFEVWFLMHFERFARPISAGGRRSPCENLIRILRTKPGFNGYRKGQQSHFQLLQSRLQTAKIYADQVLTQSILAGDPEHHGNPTTYVHKLVGALEDLAENQKR